MNGDLRNARSRRIADLVFVSWWGLFAILPLGHLTGLRNAWTVLLVLVTLLWAGRDAWDDLPGRGLLVALLAWCALSIAWSSEPQTSFAKWRGDLLLPLLAYAAAYGFVKRTQSIDAIAGGLVTGLVLLASVSSFAYIGPFDPVGIALMIRTESFPTIEQPMPVWYPGVGDASMVAALAAGVLVFLPALAVGIRRSIVVIGWIALVLIVLVSNNRNAQIGIPLVVITSAWWLHRRRTPAPSKSSAVPWRTRRNAAVVAIVVLMLAIVGMRLESGARERLEALRIPLVPDESAFLQLTARDTRPMIWLYYGRLALQHPWIGVGFGRTVPGVHFHTQADQELARVEVNAYSHAHNLFLNWWLQTGLIGFVLFAAALVRVVTVVIRRSRPGLAWPAVGATIATTALMLIRNVTDDFLVFGMATMFWSLIGALAAASVLRTDAASVSEHRLR